MRKFERCSPPDFLKENWKRWSNAYKQNREANNNFPFQWPQFQNERINLLLEPYLLLLTELHCSYCDNFPVREREDSIDHFRPKGVREFYGLVCKWENLYYCCHNCQSWKLESFDETLLKPDDIAYEFDTYFLYNFIQHKLEPNPLANQRSQARANKTIEIFGLNDFGNREARRISKERYDAMVAIHPDIDIDDFAFRFMLE